MFMDFINNVVEVGSSSSSNNFYEDPHHRLQRPHLQQLVRNNQQQQRRRFFNNCSSNENSINGVVVGVAPDVNFNSPGHRSSQDGSFIQDEDMHLILEFCPPKTAMMNADVMDEATATILPTTTAVGVISDSWRGRNTELATNFDANVAELDFDEFSTGDMINLKTQRYTSILFDQQDCCNRNNNSTTTIMKNNNNNATNNNINRILMRNSLDFSLALSGGSLFSSSAEEESRHERGEFDAIDDEFLGCFDNKNNAVLSPATAETLVKNAGGGLAFISTDSLDISSLSVHEENLKAACATKKREYVLTFDDNNRMMGESGVIDFASMVASSSSKLNADNLLLKRFSVDNFLDTEKVSSSLLFDDSKKFRSLPNLGRSSLARHRRRRRQRFFTDKFFVDNSEKVLLYDVSSGVEKSTSISVAVVEEDENNCKKEEEKETVTIERTDEENKKEDEEEETENNQTANYQPKFVLVDDYEYSEFYLNGRYIDVNHNEIGYVPPTPSSRMILKENDEETDENFGEIEGDNAGTLPCQQMKPTRTFATLLEEKSNVGASSTVESSSYCCNKNYSSPNERKSLTSCDRNSSTQIPIYVVDQSVQTTAKDDGKLVTTISYDEKPPSPLYNCNNKSNLKTSSYDLANYLLPDLSFMKFPFVVPALFPSVPPFPVAFLTNSVVQSLPSPSFIQQQPPPQPHSSSSPQLKSPPRLFLPNSANFSLLNADDRRFLSSTKNNYVDLPNPPMQKFSSMVQQQQPCTSYTNDDDEEADDRRDSGLGSSGPLHIQDWESLATLLPKEVVQACSFFKVNSNLLRNGCGTGETTTTTMKKDMKNLRPLSDTAFNFRRNPITSPKKCRKSRSSDYCRSESTRQYRNCCCCNRPTSCCRSVVRRCCTCLSPPPPACCCCTQMTPRCCRIQREEKRFCHRCTSLSSRRGRYHFPPTYCGEFSETTITSDTDDDEEEEGDYCLPNYVRSTFSEYLPKKPNNDNNYYCRYDDDYSYLNDVPKFYSLQNVKELNDLYGQPVGFPLKRPTTTTRPAAAVRCDCCAINNGADSTKPCATCFRVRSPSAERRYHDFFCDCRTSDILEEKNRRVDCTQCRRTNVVIQPTNIAERTLKKLNDEEKAAQKTYVYRQKQDMVDQAVCVCDELISNLSQKRIEKQQANLKSNDTRSINGLVVRSLCSAMEFIVSDGLLPGRNVWIVVQASATLGPATKSIHELVTDLNSMNNNSRECSLKFASFVRGLLRLRCLDCWLSYLVLKDKILRENYEEWAFLQKATSAYKTLFNRLLMAVQPLSMLTFDFGGVQTTTKSDDLYRNFVDTKEVHVTFQTRRNNVDDDDDDDEEKTFESKKYDFIPTRLPSDSRIPKSSSVPSKLVACGVGTSSTTPKSMSVDSGFSLKINYNGNNYCLNNNQKSRIPLLKSSRSCLATTKNQSTLLTESALSMDASVFDEGSECGDERVRYVCAIDTTVTHREGFLSFAKGETLILLDEFDNGYLRCQREGVVGLVDRCKVTYVTFL